MNSNHGTHFDVPATLLSVLEVGFEGRFGLGTTLMDGDGFLWTEKAYRDDAGRALQSDIERSKAIKTFLASREVRNFVEEFSR
ncbi:MAG: hypothetical protein IH848_10495 [Acidobacteria bacterium]|nr:hypothetical protein [Acidobacteriota bacterium]